MDLRITQGSPSADEVKAIEQALRLVHARRPHKRFGRPTMRAELQHGVGSWRRWGRA